MFHSTLSFLYFKKKEIILISSAASWYFRSVLQQINSALKYIKKSKTYFTNNVFFSQNAKTAWHSPIIQRLNKIYLIYRKHSTPTRPMMCVFTETLYMLHKNYIKLPYYCQHKALLFLNESQSPKCRICEVALCKPTSNCNCWNEHLGHSVPKERYQRPNLDWFKTKQLFERHNQ